MQSTTLTYTATDGVPIHVYAWTPDTVAGAKGVIHIAHGLAEHAARYARVAEALTAAGYLVYANDHRGHGQTAQSPDDLGFFAPRGGASLCVADLAGMIAQWKTAHPGLPVVLLGHSMGSFLAQQYMIDHGDTINAVVLSGSNGKPTRDIHVMRLLAWCERLRLGRKGKSPLLHKLAFEDLNKRFEPGRTRLDWLSRDGQEVDKYIADPLCGFVASAQLWLDLGGLVLRAAKPANQARIPKDLPVYIFAGAADPVNGKLKGLQQLLGAYARAGLENVSHTFYPEGRHEMLNEINRDEVTRDLIGWLDQQLTSRSRPSEA